MFKNLEKTEKIETLQGKPLTGVCRQPDFIWLIHVYGEEGYSLMNYISCGNQPAYTSLINNDRKSTSSLSFPLLE